MKHIENYKGWVIYSKHEMYNGERFYITKHGKNNVFDIRKSKEECRKVIDNLPPETNL